MDSLLRLLAGVLLLTICSGTNARDVLEDIRACQTISASSQRLACYDREISKLARPQFSGVQNQITDVFIITQPTWLRFQCDGATFVMYLLNERDEVVQNLNLAGGGESRYLIHHPGSYFLQINSNEAWRIWLEPVAEKTQSKISSNTETQ